MSNTRDELDEQTQRAMVFALSLQQHITRNETYSTERLSLYAQAAEFHSVGLPLQTILLVLSVSKSTFYRRISRIAEHSTGDRPELEAMAEHARAELASLQLDEPATAPSTTGGGSDG